MDKLTRYVWRAVVVGLIAIALFLIAVDAIEHPEHCYTSQQRPHFVFRGFIL